MGEPDPPSPAASQARVKIAEPRRPAGARPEGDTVEG